MNGMPYPYMQNNVSQGMPNNMIGQNPAMNHLMELENRISRLERQVKRLEAQVFQNAETNQSDYSASPPKDSGMYMM